MGHISIFQLKVNLTFLPLKVIVFPFKVNVGIEGRRWWCSFGLGGTRLDHRIQAGSGKPTRTWFIYLYINFCPHDGDNGTMMVMAVMILWYRWISLYSAKEATERRIIATTLCRRCSSTSWWFCSAHPETAEISMRLRPSCWHINARVYKPNWWYYSAMICKGPQFNTHPRRAELHYHKLLDVHVDYAI